MARPKNANPRERIQIRLSPDVISRLELEAFIPQQEFTGSPQGLKSQIVEAALRRYFKEKDKERKERRK